MKIRNVSGDDRIITPPNADPISVDAGQDADVDDELGASLLEQEDVWQAATSKKKEQ